METKQQPAAKNTQPEPTPTALGSLMAQIRSDQGLSLFELAKRTGIHRSTLMRIEEGATTTPDTQTLNALAKALGTDPEDLYDALWQDKSEPLPSAAIYLRSKYRLSDDQAKQAEQFLDHLTDPDTK